MANMESKLPIKEKKSIFRKILLLKPMPSVNQIKETLSKVKTSMDKVESRDVVVLLVGLKAEDAKLAKQCAEGLEKISYERKELFTAKHVSALVGGMKNEETVPHCMLALSNLAGMRAKLFTGKHVDALMEGMKNEVTAFYCSPVFSNLTGNRADLFTGKHVDVLLWRMKNEETAILFARALSNLAGMRAKLFTGKHVDALMEGMKDKETASGCGSVLANLAVDRAELFTEQHVRSLIAGLGNKDSRRECAHALSYLSYRADAVGLLLSSFKTFGEAEKKFLAEHNLTEYTLAHAAELKEKFNIEFIARYPEKILEDMLEGKRDFSKPLAIIAYPKSDHTGAFYSNHIHKLHEAGYQVVIFEAGTESSFIETAEKIRNRWGQASLLWIGGHGNPFSIQLGKGWRETNLLDITDIFVLKRVAYLLTGEVEDRKPQIVLEACSTGKKKMMINIARIISKKTLAEVFAPDTPTRIVDVRFTYVTVANRKIPRIDFIDYGGEVETIYEKGRLR